MPINAVDFTGAGARGEKKNKESPHANLRQRRQHALRVGGRACPNFPRRSPQRSSPPRRISKLPHRSPARANPGNLGLTRTLTENGKPELAGRGDRTQKTRSACFAKTQLRCALAQKTLCGWAWAAAHSSAATVISSPPCKPISVAKFGSSGERLRPRSKARSRVGAFTSNGAKSSRNSSRAGLRADRAQNGRIARAAVCACCANDVSVLQRVFAAVVPDAQFRVPRQTWRVPAPYRTRRYACIRHADRASMHGIYGVGAGTRRTPVPIGGQSSAARFGRPSLNPGWIPRRSMWATRSRRPPCSKRRTQLPAHRAVVSERATRRTHIPR